MTREEAEKELIAMLEEAEGGPSYSMEEVDAYMRELLHPKNQIYLTGDTHGQFERIISFCERQQVQPESTFIILGDVGLNYPENTDSTCAGSAFVVISQSFAGLLSRT